MRGATNFELSNFWSLSTKSRPPEILIRLYTKIRPEKGGLLSKASELFYIVDITIIFSIKFQAVSGYDLLNSIRVETGAKKFIPSKECRSGGGSKNSE